MFELLAFVYGPRLAEMLAALLPYALLVGGIKVVDLDGEFPAHVVEQHLRHFQSCRWQSTGQSRVAVPPFLFRFRQFIQRLVADRQQSTLFKVRQRDAPAPFQIPVQPVAEHGAECGLGVLQRLKSHQGIAGVQIERQFQGLEHLLGQRVVWDTIDSSLQHRPVQSGAQQANLDEVVEVSGLERSVLAVVREAEQLASSVVESGLVSSDCGSPTGSGRWWRCFCLRN